jgi:hypothetical protein
VASSFGASLSSDSKRRSAPRTSPSANFASTFFALSNSAVCFRDENFLVVGAGIASSSLLDHNCTRDFVQVVRFLTPSVVRGTGKTPYAKEKREHQADTELSFTTSRSTLASAEATWIRAPFGTRRNVGTDCLNRAKRIPKPEGRVESAFGCVDRGPRAGDRGWLLRRGCCPS